VRSTVRWAAKAKLLAHVLLLLFAIGGTTSVFAADFDGHWPNAADESPFVQSGFCPDGVYPLTTWAVRKPPAGTALWGSHCGSGDQNTGWMATPSFRAEKYLSLYLAGYPGRPGVRVAIQNLKSRSELALAVKPPPGESWQKYTFAVPSDWVGQPVRVLAVDESSGWGGWLGMASPVAAGPPVREGFVAARLAGSVLLFCILTLLPPAAVCILMLRFGVDDLVILTTIAVLTIGFLGVAAFWFYFLGKIAGIIFSYAVLLVSIVLLVIGIFKWRSVPFSRAYVLMRPWILVITGTLFVTSLGFLYSGENTALTIATHRFLEDSLSVDNALPKIFADDVFSSSIPKPMITDWLSSDRPPLQSGVALWHYAWTRGSRNLPYQVVGTFLQLSCIVGIWVYLWAAEVNSKVMALALAATIFSGFVIVNSFFVWPKLIAVTFLLLPATFLLTPRFRQACNRWSIGVAVGSAAAFAMLSHGGSAFALLGLVIVLLLLRRIPGPRFIAAAIVSASLLYAPWSLYQKYYDPPGDRLLKWHLAGTIPPRPEISFTKLMSENYAQLSPREIVWYKVSNFKLLAKDHLKFWKNVGILIGSSITNDVSERSRTVSFIKKSMYLYWLQALDFLVLAIICLPYMVARRTSSPELATAWQLFVWIITVLVIWCLLMFGPAATFVIHGTYLTLLGSFACLLLASWAVSPILATCVGMIHIVFNMAAFVVLSPLGESVGVIQVAPNRALAWVGVIAAVATIAVLWNMAGTTTSLGRALIALDENRRGRRDPVPLKRQNL
jgi:hypothetical protein